MLRQTENAFRFFCYVDCLYGKNGRRKNAFATANTAACY